MLLRAGEVIPVERLIDEIWSERPPPSAAHSLEAYVSRLRRVLAPHGVSIERRGDGYRIDLGEAVLDLRVFEALVAEAAEAAAAGDDGRAAAHARAALDLWRGPVLAGVPLHLDGRADAARLEALRLRALEIRVDADLSLGRHAELVGELPRLVEENPYRERLVAQLMIALYRSGRQVEALETYEGTRRVLMQDLGIQPGADLQRLSGQIVRHELELASPPSVSAVHARSPVHARSTISTRRQGAALMLVFALAATTLAVAVGVFWRKGAGGPADDAPGRRVALVLPRAPKAGREDTFVTPFVDGLLRAARDYDLETKTLVVDEFEPTPARLDEIRGELRTGNFAFVLWAGWGVAAHELSPLVRHLPATRFVYVDASLRKTPLEDAPNATALTFADEEAGFLAGYLAGLVTTRQRPLGSAKPLVSVVAGFPFPQVMGLVHGFARGAREARPGIAVRVSYSRTFTDQAVCERIANRQIDRGSAVVFAASGTCGLGALAAAGLRGVWGVGADADRSGLGSHILVSTVKRYDRAVELAVRWFVEGSLPAGDVVLGLDDDAVGIAGVSPEVSPDARRSLARLEASLRKAEATRNHPEAPN